MKKETILKKAIEKAVKNGYKPMRFQRNVTCQNYFMIIFSHDFAKAFWGEGEKVDYRKPCPHCGGKIAIANPTGKCSHIHYPEACDVCEAYYTDWTDHLQQMVLEKDPIKYLEKFL